MLITQNGQTIKTLSVCDSYTVTTAHQQSVISSPYLENNNWVNLQHIFHFINANLANVSLKKVQYCYVLRLQMR